jgi:glycolate oxidase iron-sulfur subunit
MHLVDHARAHIEQTYRRPWRERVVRALLANVLPYRRRFRVANFMARLAKPLAPLFAAMGLQQIAAMLRLAPISVRRGNSDKEAAAAAPRTGRVALLAGCVNDVLAPSINAAASRVLTRHGIEVVHAAGEGCCGGLVHHMGKEHAALALARNNIDAWTREMANGLDAIVITTSGCGTTIKDYGFMFRNEPAYAEKAAKVSALAKDIAEYLAPLELKPAHSISSLRVAYHSPCSLQHGQKVTREPKALLTRAGLTVIDIPEGHLCCGSAGTYNMLQPAIAGRLAARKAANIESVSPDVVATSNLGCMIQIEQATVIPLVHLVELIDWATGGPAPAPLRAAPNRAAKVAPIRKPAL